MQCHWRGFCRRKHGLRGNHGRGLRILSMGCPRDHNEAHKEMRCRWRGLCERKHGLLKCHDQGLHEFEKEVPKSNDHEDKHNLGDEAPIPQHIILMLRLSQAQSHRQRLS
eukprot:1741738-Karenia_brevis.AAC.1